MPMGRELKNMLSTESAHGGRVFEAARWGGIAPEAVIDFSANINPLAPPSGVMAAIEKCLAPVSLMTYPDSHAFVSALGEKHGVDHDEVVIGPGSAALLFATMRALRPATTVVIEP